MFITKLGIDLGTANTLVFVPGKGIILNEPSVVAISEEGKVMAVGLRAKEMLGRTPGNITAYRPLRRGVIADYHVTEAMLKYFFERAGVSVFWRPELMISVPAGITSTERRAVIKAASAAGARKVWTVREPILAALGAGMAINESSGNMIVNIGGGTSEIAVISLGGIVTWESIRIGGDDIDEAIGEYIRKTYSLAVGESSAEKIKIQIGSALRKEQEEEMAIKGRDLVEGLPKTLVIKTNEITEAIAAPLAGIINGIRKVLSITPPELSADIMEKGMLISGGGGMLGHIDGLIAKVTKVPAYIAPDPLFCVAKGTGIALENLEAYKRSVA
ncbi:MAG: rod shape-determining protein [Candidatus Portnoybacteria bacterium]|nr:rod shape-determining protein [Candidatus Portnoybacteria bacterium]